MTSNREKNRENESRIFYIGGETMERRKLVSLGNSAERVEARAHRLGRYSRYAGVLLAVMVVAAVASRYGVGYYAQEITS